MLLTITHQLSRIVVFLSRSLPGGRSRTGIMARNVQAALNTSLDAWKRSIWGVFHPEQGHHLLSDSLIRWVTATAVCSNGTHRDRSLFTGRQPKLLVAPRRVLRTNSANLSALPPQFCTRSCILKLRQ